MTSFAYEYGNTVYDEAAIKFDEQVIAADVAAANYDLALKRVRKAKSMRKASQERWDKRRGGKKSRKTKRKRRKRKSSKKRKKKRTKKRRRRRNMLKN